ncbi:mitochondrial intermembrane space import and assembly protein 40-A [Coccinella septempunctata]|uniref:mitochondrial intermembrane space import and assembly protein 40-A n=1 Tax=Coccinella septempunctata TaxID=41139 RepID=UPI001D05E100|nr:mitochondrial intermembrane space import and assembly protein 40-A [Coccinella septempunctata]
MSICKEFGKDKVIFATEEDHKVPSTIKLPEPDPQPGLILPNGDINWNCPCLGGMATGPCGYEFRNAFSCFHYSEADPKGSDCYEKFKTMQTCMQQYPTLYNKDIADDDDFTGLDEPKGNLTAPNESKGSTTKVESESASSKTEIKNPA